MRSTVAVLFVVAAALAPALRASSGGRPRTALDLLRERRPEVVSRLDTATRAVLSVVTAAQAEALRRGGGRLADLRLPQGTPLPEFLESVLGDGTYAVPFFSLDAGGGESAGGGFRVLGTIGQPDAAVLSEPATGYTLVGGVRGRLSGFALFRDGFESGDSNRWSTTIP
jgi:hypothetical protein